MFLDLNSTVPPMFMVTAIGIDTASIYLSVVTADNFELIAPGANTILLLQHF